MVKLLSYRHTLRAFADATDGFGTASIQWLLMRIIRFRIEYTYIWFIFLVCEFGSWLSVVESDSASDMNSSLSEIGQDFDLAILNYLNAITK